MALQLVHPQASPLMPAQSQALGLSLEDRGGDVAWVQAAGELVGVTAPQLERTLRRAQRRAQMVVLDLRRLTFADQSGMQVLVCAGIRARRSGRQLILVRGLEQGDRGFAPTPGADRLRIVHLDPGVPAVQALLVLAREDQAA